jgi:hypothetical protein
VTRILLRGGKSPFDVIDPVSSLEDYPAGVFAKNVGNLVFSDSMHRILSIPGAEVVPNSFLAERDGVTPPYVDRINSKFDHFVIPLANAFRMSFIGNLDILTETISKLKIPVTVVGVGVRGGANSLDENVDDVPDDLKRSVSRFVSTVLDHSATIGVRGENTRAFLESIGFNDDKVDVIGCPSLFRYGGDLRVEKRVDALTPDSEFSMNISPYVPYMGGSSLYHAKKYPNMTYIPQDLATLRLLTWGTNPRRFSPKMPTNDQHPFYQQDRIRFFVDSFTWINHLKTQEFSFGTRIHGNIAALMAGTPAHVLVHDTRTQELADFHEIPYTLIEDLPPRVDAADLYERSDYSRFNAGHRARFDNFTAFLEKNGIEHIFEEGKANPEYDEKLAALPLPGPVRRIPEDQLAMAQKMRWMYSQLPPNSKRENYGFTTAVPYSRPTPPERVGLARSAMSRALRRLKG